MKNILKVLLLVVSLLIVSCGKRTDGYFKRETIDVKVKITYVSRAKYSKVEGYFVRDGIQVPIDNGNSGYHYKTYNLKEGQVINCRIYKYYTSIRDGYKVEFSDLDVSKYEID